MLPMISCKVGDMFGDCSVIPPQGQLIALPSRVDLAFFLKPPLLVLHADAGDRGPASMHHIPLVKLTSLCIDPLNI